MESVLSVLFRKAKEGHIIAQGMKSFLTNPKPFANFPL